MEVVGNAGVEVKESDVSRDTEEAGVEIVGTEENIPEGTDTECIGTENVGKEDAGVENAAGGETVTELLCTGVTTGTDEARTEDGGAE